MSSLFETVLDRKVIVLCGAGGVGKTTTAAALATQLAIRGKRVLALTIDPSKRLAQALGVSMNSTTPESVSLGDAVAATGTSRVAGSLDVWVLNVAELASGLVEQALQDPEKSKRLRENSIFKELTQIISGMHEYMAVKALHRFLNEGRYDCIVLDTPPSRHALDFLEAPGRTRKFIEGKFGQYFVPAEGGMLRRAASTVVHQIMSAVLGKKFAEDLVEFFSLFRGVFSLFSVELEQMRKLLNSQDAAFFVVTAPTHESIEEALFFEKRSRALGVYFEGFFINRSIARATEGAVDLVNSTLDLGVQEKFSKLARIESAQVLREHELLVRLVSQVGEAKVFRIADMIELHAQEVNESGHNGPSSQSVGLKSLILLGQGLSRDLIH